MYYELDREHLMEMLYRLALEYPNGFGFRVADYQPEVPPAAEVLLEEILSLSFECKRINYEPCIRLSYNERVASVYDTVFFHPQEKRPTLISPPELNQFRNDVENDFAKRIAEAKEKSSV